MDNELYHHGVKGMKWGIRKSVPTAGGQVGNRKVKKTFSVKSVSQALSAKKKRFNERLKVKSANRAERKAAAKVVKAKKTADKIAKAKAKAKVKAKKTADKIAKEKAKTEAKAKKTADKIAKANAKTEAKQQAMMAKNAKAREEALTTHDPEVLQKNMHLLTYKELNDRYNRLNLEKNVRNLTPKKESKAKQVAEAAFKFANSEAGQKVIKEAWGVAYDKINKKTGGALDDVAEDVGESKGGDDGSKKKKKKDKE
jgi:hypothetical protein